MTFKIDRFLREQRPQTPCLVVDLDVVIDNFGKLRRALPQADVFYAVKANPARPILEALSGLGSNFDAASAEEVLRCLDAGASPDRISFGNTVKKDRDIRIAFEHGVDLFAFDSEGELEKLARGAPGAKVFCRIATSGEGADWPLSRKFGCDLDVAADLMVRARELGLDPYGISFHVGSQQSRPDQWDIAIGRTAMVFSDLRRRGVELRMINLGGGFPARYREDVLGVDSFGDAIMDSLIRHFGNRLPRILIEPGRSVVAEAGVLETEVVLVSRKCYDPEAPRWVYLDAGKFGGLAETMDEAIRYAIETPHDGRPEGPVMLAGPTCDGADILYEKSGYTLPLDLKSGDRVRLLCTGAYTATYASIGFNGFAPLNEHYI